MSADTVQCANCPLSIFFDGDDWRHDEHEGITCGSDAYRDPWDHATPVAEYGISVTSGVSAVTK